MGPPCMVECSASAISTVASPNFMVSPPFATINCFSGAPSFLAVSTVIGAPTTDAPVCRATGPMVEMRVRDEDRLGLRHVARLEAERMAARRAVEMGVKQIDLALVAKFEIGVGEPADDDRVGLRRGQRSARHGGLVTVASVRDIGGERSSAKS